MRLEDAMKQATPGPWRVVPGAAGFHIRAANGRYVTAGHDDREGEINSALITDCFEKRLELAAALHQADVFMRGLAALHPEHITEIAEVQMRQVRIALDKANEVEGL